MIKINGFNYEWKKGITVKLLLHDLSGDERLKYAIDNTTTVIINSVIIAPNEYPNRQIVDGDDIILFPMLVGG